MQLATGALPATAALVYLNGDRADVRYLDVGEVTARALDAAREAVEGVWRGEFPICEQECGYCVGRKLCGRPSQTTDEVGEPEEKASEDEIREDE